MSFLPGDRVHIAGIGTGVVREARNGGRYVVEVKGRTLVAPGGQLERVEERRPRGRTGHVDMPAPERGRDTRGAASIDLHGKSVAEALEAFDAFLNDALLAGLNEIRVVHGRSGGRIRAAVHQRLAQLPIRSYRLDERNAGVTIVIL